MVAKKKVTAVKKVASALTRGPAAQAHVHIYYAVSDGEFLGRQDIIVPGGGLPVGPPGTGGPPHRVLSQLSFDVLDGRYTVEVQIKAAG